MEERLLLVGAKAAHVIGVYLGEWALMVEKYMLSWFTFSSSYFLCLSKDFCEEEQLRLVV